MKRTMESSLKYMMVCGLILAAGIISLSMQAFIAKPVLSVPTLPVLWTAGGLDPGNTGAGQAARIASDASGNVAVVSGPSLARDLAVTSYTASGSFRWRSAVTPATGTFAGDWVVAAPNGDFVAVGHNLTAGGQSIAITMVRYASDGTLLWQVDLARTLPSVARLEVDAGGNVYLAFSSVGDGQDIQLHKYDPSGNLLWSQVISTGFFANDYATSLALSPDGADVMLTGDIAGGATWITAAFNATTGVRAWLVTAAEGVAAKDVVVDDSHVYVTGQGNVGINSFLTVVAYDRATGARLWRTDKKPTDATGAAGLRMDIAPDGSLVVTGQANRGFLDWYTVSFETTGVVRWEAVRDGGLNTDEVPTGVLVLADGTAVVTGPGGPNLPGGFIPGVTVGYSSNGTLLWDAFAQLSTVWVTSLPNGDVCATGGYDALITCWRPSSGMSTPTPPPGPTSTPAPPANTGFLSPSANTAQTSGAGDNDGYQTSPVNAYTNDSLLSVAVDTDSGTNTNISCTDSGKDKHLYYNYNLNMPASAIIQGIQVRLGARVDATGGSPKICVQLSWDGGTSWTTAKATANLGTTETTYTLGSVLTTWGRTWNASDFNNGNFRLRVIDVAGDTNRDFFLDYVTVNVTFQP